MFPKGSWPVWFTGKKVWAPEIHYVNGAYHVYFSAESNINKQCSIGVARGSSPTGPFTDLGAPLIEFKKIGVIDAHYFKDPK